MNGNILIKDIDGHNGCYLITSEGKAFNKRGLQIKSSLDKHGYERISLSRNNISRPILFTD